MRELEDFAVAELESGMPVVTQKCLHHLSVSFAAALQEKVSELTMPAPPPARSSIGFFASITTRQRTFGAGSVHPVFMSRRIVGEASPGGG